jgi:uncharacterized protein YjbI with pentapeptide repeats
MKLIFCDTNKSLRDKVTKVFQEQENRTHCNLIVSKKDLLKTKKDYPNALITTASNPNFNMAGGIDGIMANNYPDEIINAREFKFTDNLFFTVTCNKELKTDKKIIQRALLGIYFASRKNDIIFTGLGTGVAGLSEDDFIDELKKFISVDFRSADFSYANFSYINFSYANFSSANFRYANFSYANFSYANFRYANFRYANFRSANFRSAIFNYRITPEVGKFIGWKKTQNKIIKLEIQNAKNVSGGLVSRKLRTDKVKVLQIQTLDGKKCNDKNIPSDYNSNFIYIVGQIAIEPDFIKNDLIECSNGIHFFLTRDEAVKYN